MVELFVFAEAYSFVESILLYKWLVLNEFLRAEVSVRLGKNNTGIFLISSGSQL